MVEGGELTEFAVGPAVGLEVLDVPEALTDVVEGATSTYRVGMHLGGGVGILEVGSFRRAGSGERSADHVGVHDNVSGIGVSVVSPLTGQPGQAAFEVVDPLFTLRMVAAGDRHFTGGDIFFEFAYAYETGDAARLTQAAALSRGLAGADGSRASDRGMPMACSSILQV